MNAYQDKLQASLLGKPKSKHWLFAYYAFATNHHSLAQARSGAIRTLIGQWHDCPGLSSPTWKLWEFVQPKKRAKEIRSGGHLGRGVVLDRGAIYTPGKKFEDKEIKTENV